MKKEALEKEVAQKTFEKIKQTTNEYNKFEYDLNRVEDFDVSIRPDNTVSPASFKPDPLIPGGYKAHPLTIRAMKKNIFVAADVDRLKEPYTCESCHQSLDKQFWHLCPFCGKQFRTN